MSKKSKKLNKKLKKLQKAKEQFSLKKDLKKPEVLI